jgi:hypothetical protein
MSDISPTMKAVFDELVLNTYAPHRFSIPPRAGKGALVRAVQAREKFRDPNGLDQMAGLFFRALERRASEQYQEERSCAEWFDLGGES